MGLKKCESNCSTCPYIEEGTEAYFPNADVTIKSDTILTVTVGICCTKFGARGAMVIILDEQLVLKKGYHTIKPAPLTKPIGRKKSIYISTSVQKIWQYPLQ